MTKFIIVDKHEVISKHKVTYKEIGSDVEQYLEYQEISPKYYQCSTRLPEGYVEVHKMTDWYLDCVHDLDSYDDMIKYGDFDYWCVEIDGQMYESTNHNTEKPDWATHFSYYSQ